MPSFWVGSFSAPHPPARSSSGECHTSLFPLCLAPPAAAATAEAAAKGYANNLCESDVRGSCVLVTAPQQRAGSTAAATLGCPLNVPACHCCADDCVVKAKLTHLKKAIQVGLGLQKAHACCCWQRGRPCCCWPSGPWHVPPRAEGAGGNAAAAAAAAEVHSPPVITRLCSLQAAGLRQMLSNSSLAVTLFAPDREWRPPPLEPPLISCYNCAACRACCPPRPRALLSPSAAFCT